MIKKYKLFTTPTCPNCPEVKKFLEQTNLEKLHFDVTEEEGLKEAIRYKLSSAPTVLFFNSDDKEIGKANSIEQIKAILTERA